MRCLFLILKIIKKKCGLLIYKIGLLKDCMPNTVQSNFHKNRTQQRRVFFEATSLLREQDSRMRKRRGVSKKGEVLARNRLESFYSRKRVLCTESLVGSSLRAEGLGPRSSDANIFSIFLV